MNAFPMTGSHLIDGERATWAVVARVVDTDPPFTFVIKGAGWQEDGEAETLVDALAQVAGYFKRAGVKL